MKPVIDTTPAADVERRVRESFRGGYLVDMQQAPCPECRATLPAASRAASD